MEHLSNPRFNSQQHAQIHTLTNTLSHTSTVTERHTHTNILTHIHTRDMHTYMHRWNIVPWLMRSTLVS